MTNRHMFRDISLVIRSNWMPLVTMLALIAIQSALQPSSAWISKVVLEAYRKAGTTLESLVLDYGVLWLALTVALTLLGFSEKIINKILQLRIVLQLQRIYLERRHQEHCATDASRIIYSADVAKKGIEVIYKESWKMGTEIVSVLIWQLSIGPEWIPIMLLSVLPSVAFVWILGPRLQASSERMLQLQGSLAEYSSKAKQHRFTEQQQAFYKNSLRFEVLKWFADEAMSILLWACLGLILTAIWLLDLSILPNQLELGSVAAFIINLKLLAKPLSDIGKVYSKWCEARPAMVQLFTPIRHAAPCQD